MTIPAIAAGIFDTILFFRINELQEQLENGLLEGIKRILKTGGKFIGSGDFEASEEARKLLGQKFTIEALQELPNSDYTGFLYRTHVGFVLGKAV